MWCYCGKVAKYLGRCERHQGKEPKKKIEKINKFRGDSKWALENGKFVSK